MDLNWDAEQVEVRLTVRRFLADHGEQSADDPPRRLLPGLGDLGLLGMSVPEPQGGSGTSLVTEMILFEELGRALAGGRIFSSAAVAVPLVCASTPGTRFADGLLSGRQTAAVAWSGSTSSWHLQAGGADITVERPAGRVHLTGTLPLVLGAAEADLLVVVTGGATPSAYLVDPLADGVTVRPRSSVDPGTPLADVTLRQTPGVALLDGPEAGEATSQVLDRAVLLAGAEAVGLAEAVLALAVEHVKTRTQFGRPIGAYQAVSHPIVDVYAALELTRSLSLLAATLLEGPAEPRRAVLAGFALSSAELGTRACEVAIQVHGGLGMTWDLPLHRFYKRAKVLRSMIGPASIHRNCVAAHLASPTR